MTTDRKTEHIKLEHQFLSLMTKYGVRCIEAPPQNGRQLDFYLPTLGIYVELKTWSCERLHHQLEAYAGRPIIVLVGFDSVRAFANVLEVTYTRGISVGEIREREFQSKS